MKKMHYRTSVNINDKVMKLGFRGQLAQEHQGKKIRVQAIFTQRKVDRRFPMEVQIEETDIGPQIRADARIELEYVFLTPPRRKVNVTFAVWFGMEEMILDDQPFPVQKEMFARPDTVRRKSYVRFLGMSAALPVLIGKNLASSGGDMDKAKKKANESVYKSSGISYSPRQRNTNYFADQYQTALARSQGPVKNRVLFLSERALEDKDNLARVREIFARDPDLETADFLNTRTVDALSKAELRECAMECARAGVIILEDFYPQLHALNLHPQTTVVQLWHACGAFKTFGYSHMDKPGGAPQSSMNHRNYDLVTVSSEKMRGIYAEAFAVPYHKVQALGSARTDDLLDPHYKELKRTELLATYPLLQNKRIVLFAPTFRGEGNKDAYYPDQAFDIRSFMETMPEDVVLILRNHPFVKETPVISPDYEGRVMDYTGLEHINDLMMISDLLITDYSSSIFEAAILDLPMVFYAFDLEEYIADRDFYFDYYDMVPGPVTRDQEELNQKALELLNKGREAMDSERLKGFKEDFLSAIDGHSTERICAYIKDRFLKLD